MTDVTVARHNTCPTCGHPVAPPLAGELSPLKRIIYDLIARAGNAGISTPALLDRVYVGIRDEEQPSTKKVIHTHICQLNKFLRTKGVAIINDHRVYRLVALKSRA